MRLVEELAEDEAALVGAGYEEEAAQACACAGHAQQAGSAARAAAKRRDDEACAALVDAACPHRLPPAAATAVSGLRVRNARAFSDARIALVRVQCPSLEPLLRRPRAAAPCPRSTHRRTHTHTHTHRTRAPVADVSSIHRRVARCGSMPPPAGTEICFACPLVAAPPAVIDTRLPPHPPNTPPRSPPCARRRVPSERRGSCCHSGKACTRPRSGRTSHGV